MSLDDVRAAAEAQAAAREALAQTTDELHNALREAKALGHTESELATAAGLTRQRVWQITKTRTSPSPREHDIGPPPTLGS